MKYFILINLVLSFSASANFKDTLKLMIEKSPVTVKAMHETEKMRKFQQSSKSALYLPSISFDISRNLSESYGAEVETEYTQGSLNLNYNLFSFGQDYQTYKSDVYGFQAQKESEKAQNLKSEAELATLLLSYLRAFERAKLYKKILTLKKKIYKQTNLRFKRGSLSKRDLLKVEVEMNNAQVEESLAREALGKILTHLLPYELNVEGLVYPWEKTFGPSMLNSLTQMKVDITPAVKSLVSQEKKNLALLKASKKANWGKFNLSYSRNIYQGTDDASEQYGWGAAVIYSIPLFDNFNYSKRTYAHKANYLSAKSTRTFQAEKDRQSQVSAMSNLKLSYNAYKERQRNLNISEQLYNESSKLFRKGRISVNELFIEQDRYLRTRTLSIEALNELHLDIMNAFHAKGKSIL